MADNKLNYQQARNVRKSKFSDMVLDQLAQQDTGVFGAIGKTISLRSQARMKGIKEKFDPLNIIKFMTMGSRFGPALFGKLTGRNQKDIDYFTGRTKSVVGSRNTADRLKKVGGDGDSEGINEQLSKIFSFLQNSREEDVKLRELAKNSEEEIAMEKGKRHKEMIDTLQKLMKHMNSGGQVVTAEPVKQTSFLDDIWEKLKGLADLVSVMKDTLLEVGKKLGMKGLEALAKAGKWGANVVRAAAPTVAAAAVVGGAIYGADYLAGEYLGVGKNADGTDKVIDEKKDEENWKKMNTAEKIESGLARTIEAVGDILAPNVTAEAKAERLKNETEYLKNKKPETTNYTAPEAPEGYQFDAEGGLTPIPGYKPKSPPAAPAAKNQSVTPPAPPAEPNRGRPTMQNDPRLNQITEPSSAPVSSLSNTNMELNLPKPSDKGADTTLNKTVNNITTQKQERTGLKPSQISVRNDEPTFMQLIIDSTRVV